MKNKPGESFGPDMPVNIVQWVYSYLLIDYAQNKIVGVYPYRYLDKQYLVHANAIYAASILNYGKANPSAEVLDAIDTTA